jgi:hypothetical protein
MHPSFRKSSVRAEVASVSLIATLLFALPAQGAPDPLGSVAASAGAPCDALARELSHAEQTARECEEARRSAAEECRNSVQQLAATTAKLSEVESRVAACTADKGALCREAAEFAHKLAQGHVTNAGQCIASADQEQLIALFRGWDAASRALAQLGAFSAGETDTLPSPGAASQAERLVGRLLGERQKEPLFYRRLLIEAMRYAAPEAWNRIQRSGPVAIHSWFSSSAPLDFDLVGEVERKQGNSSSSGGSSLTAALHLVTAFALVARCSVEAPTHGCARARQLEQLIESTGPLLLRRRIEDVWSTDCGDTSPDVTLRWIDDFPSGRLQPSDFAELAVAVRTKLFTCFLDDAEVGVGYLDWLERKLPGPKLLDPRRLARMDEIRRAQAGSDAVDSCVRAVHALRTIPAAATCQAPSELLRTIESWETLDPSPGATVAARVCNKFAQALWEGQAAVIPRAFGHVPGGDDIVQVESKAPETALSRVRRACDGRQGSGTAFVEGLRTLSRVARRFGESPEAAPWRVDSGTGMPVEAVRFSRARSYGAWVRHILSRESSCATLGMPQDRCRQCMAVPQDAFFDCGLERDLQDVWRTYTRVSAGTTAGFLFVVGLLLWAIRLGRARRVFASWAAETREQLLALGLPASPDPLRFVYPARHDSLMVTLPHQPAWQQWGARAGVIRVNHPLRVQEADVHHAVAIGQRLDARVVLLLHDETASLDLGAVRAVLDWAAKGGSRATHVLPTPTSRLAWARSAMDLLELVEESSLRGNPFEVRGRITSSSQFWNREQLVSGLLGEVRAGRWHVVTGLRRFGKSSLALEVARRLPGPSAYVDLAGFHHEIAFLDNPSHAADAILRSLCARLADSARALYPAAASPDPPTSAVDAAELSRWVRALSAACLPFHDGRPPPMLLVLDEIEQALALGPERLGHALDVLAILLGRVRNALADSPQRSGSPSVGLLLCSALHPLLWAPLSTLGQQSIMGTFPYLCVPRLGSEAAVAMMRGLGARQGIRFADASLDWLVTQAQGVPLLLRRLGTSILELYDADRARQGSLGAVQIGVEGAREAVGREEQEGSPLRVWVESEIADASTAAGALLRRLAVNDAVTAGALFELAEEHVNAEFVSSGVAARLPADEQRRRTQEAARVLVRLLADTKLLDPVGDLTAPEAYVLPEGVIRRVLGRAVSGSPNAPRAR